MNEHHQANDRPVTDFDRFRVWLGGEVRVRRAILVGGALIALVCAGIALD
ncbi:MAG: hypothetical protein AAF416_20530 [Pseudomonadota bacterium]